MIILDASQMADKADAHAYLKQMLSFPEYYGNNLDALYDCLTELEETEIRFVNLSADADSYFARVLTVFQEAEAENRNLRIAYDLE